MPLLQFTPCKFENLINLECSNFAKVNTIATGRCAPRPPASAIHDNAKASPFPLAIATICTPDSEFTFRKPGSTSRYVYTICIDRTMGPGHSYESWAS